MSRRQPECSARHQQRRSLLIDAAARMLVVGSSSDPGLHIPFHPMQRRHVAVAAALAAVVETVAVAAFVAVA